MKNQYYKKYAKPKIEEKPSYIKLFFGAFFMMLIIFVVIAVHLFSSVDTAIGENDEGDIKESGLGVKHLIDSRLKFIQMEDNEQRPENDVPKLIQAPEEGTSSDSNSDDEVQMQTFSGPNYSNSYNGNNTYTQTQTTFPVSTPTESTIKRPAGVPISQTVNVKNPVYKVYIGSYSTLEQARVAQSIVQDANLGVTSFVKTTSDGIYTLQVGSYNDVTKAQNFVNELKRSHFPARMVQE